MSELTQLLISSLIKQKMQEPQLQREREERAAELARQREFGLLQSAVENGANESQVWKLQSLTPNIPPNEFEGFATLAGIRAKKAKEAEQVSQLTDPQQLAQLGARAAPTAGPRGELVQPDPSMSTVGFDLARITKGLVDAKREDLIPSVYARVGGAKEASTLATREGLAKEARTEATGIRAEQRAEAANIRSEGRAEFRGIREQDIETGAETLAYGTDEEKKAYGAYIHEQYKRPKEAIKIIARAEQAAVANRLKDESTQLEGGAAPDLLGMKMWQQAFPALSPQHAYLISKKQGVVDPWAPAGVSPFIPGDGAALTDSRIAGKQLDSSLSTLTDELHSLETSPTAEAAQAKKELAGVSGMPVFQGLRRLTASQSAITARIDTTIKFMVRDIIAMSKDSRPSDFDVRFFYEIFPLLTEIIDPRTGLVSAGAKGRIQAIQARVQALQMAPYDQLVKRTLERETKDYMKDFSAKDRALAREFMNRVEVTGEINLEEAAKVFENTDRFGLSTSGVVEGGINSPLWGPPK